MLEGYIGIFFSRTGDWPALLASLLSERNPNCNVSGAH